MYSRNLFVLDFAKNRPQKQVQERLRENILDNGGYKLEELTIDKTPVKNEKDQEAVIEAVLFTMGGAVELKQLAVSIGQDKETAKAAVDRLMKRYKTGKHGMEILQLEDSYQMCTQSKYYSNLIRIASAPKKQVLSDVVLETLSIIAYRQPVTKLEIEKIRGVKSDHAVNRLVEYNLVYEAGRYKFVEQVKEDHIDLAANEDYWGEVPAIKNVRFRPITNEATRTATMLTGDVDFTIDVSARDIDRLDATEGISVIKQKGLREIYLNLDSREDSPLFPGQKNPMSDVKVRQAMYLAIDEGTIIKNIMNGCAYEMNSVVPEDYVGYTEVTREAYDPEKAKELLAEAGYPDGLSLIHI